MALLLPTTIPGSSGSRMWMKSANAAPNSARRVWTLAIPSASVSRVMMAQIFRSAGQSALASARTVSRSFSSGSV